MTESSAATDRRLHGKVALITGAAGGLGAASARRLAAAGASLVVTDLAEDALSGLLNSLPGGGAAHIAVSGDIAVEQTTRLCVEHALERFGRIDLWHLNAGVPGAITRLPDAGVEEFDHVLAVNLRGTFLGMRAAFRLFEAQGSQGAIVATASIAGLRGSADLLAYQVSKHGVIGLVQGAAIYGGPLGVRVNAVAPGIVPTGLFGASATVGGGSDMELRAETSPLRRAGAASEVAAAVEYLLSDDASYITGQVVSVDGGASTVNTARPSGGAGRWSADDHDVAFYGPALTGRGSRHDEQGGPK